MRGENAKTLAPSESLTETSPHAWRKPDEDVYMGVVRGNISTCVEKTVSRNQIIFGIKKHLHMRGENAGATLLLLKEPETSPHAWRKPCHPSGCISAIGNISTCVEKTLHQ